MKSTKTRPVPPQPETWPSLTQVEKAIGPLDDWAHQCHAAALALVRSGLLPGDGWRVGRGSSPGVFGQHSWAVQGDPYSSDAWVVDVTAWSYEPTRDRLWRVRNLREHHPHGYGSIWGHGRPVSGDGAILSLATPLSEAGSAFLSLAFPEGADIRGWLALANCPVGGWPAQEIIEAMLDTPSLDALVPVDIAGMLTERNPGGLYR